MGRISSIQRAITIKPGEKYAELQSSVCQATDSPRKQFKRSGRDLWISDLIADSGLSFGAICAADPATLWPTGLMPANRAACLGQ
jgi:hypothetical protein